MQLGFVIGQVVFIRTITFHYTGIVKMIADGAVILESAAWVASSGRFADFLMSGEADEVEPYPSDVSVALHAIVDWCAFPAPLMVQK